jgi:hypothetical protein
MDQNTKYETTYAINTKVDFILPKNDNTICNSDETLQNLTNLIYQNKNSILNDDHEIIYNIYKQIYPINKLKRDILLFDFIHGKTNKICNHIDDTYALLLDELKIYQWIVGGYNIEDNEWLECNDNTRFKPQIHQKAIYNTIETHLVDKDLKWFLLTIEKRINQSIEIESNIKVFYKIFDDNFREISWIVLIVEQQKKIL